MKREIKFKGKSVKTGKFVTGFYFEEHEIPTEKEQTDETYSSYSIFNKNNDHIWTEIVKDSECQFTGLKNIYEKDKVRLTFFDEYSNDCVTVDSDAIIEGAVKFYEGSWIVETEKSKTWYLLFQVSEACKIEVLN